MMGFGIAAIEGLRGFATLNGGINLMTTSHKEKCRYAEESVSWNEKHFPELMKRFKNHIESTKLIKTLDNLSLANNRPPPLETPEVDVSTLKLDD